VSASRVQPRRIAIALGVSATMVVLIAALVPRAFLVNDDPGLILHLREGTLTPWMSPVLSRAFASAYQATPDVPWYGLFQYALLVASGAVLLHTCIELVDRRPGFGNVATLIVAIMLGASHIIVIVGITWTTVAMDALGIALVAFVAHLQSCQLSGTRASPLRGAIYGLLFVAGFALRDAVLAAVGAALLPLLGWLFVRFVRRRHLPRPAAVIAFLAPFVIVVGVQGHVPPLVEQTRRAEFEEFNALRGQISGAAAYAHLDTRAPELLVRAGWSADEYRDFSNWLLADDTEFTTEKVGRLVATGGIPQSMGLGDVYDVLHGIAIDSAASVWLFLTIVALGISLAMLDALPRRRVLWFSLGYLAFLAFVPVVMSAVSRFPQRVSLSFYTVAAFGMFVFLAGELAMRPPREESARPQRPLVALLAVSLCMFVWANDLIVWTGRDVASYHTPLRAFADRVKARNGMILTAPGIAELDPLLADPRGYDALPGGWGTFTAPWFRYIERFGIRSGSELLHAMVDNPNAYLIATPYAQEMYQDWLRRRIGNKFLRLSLVDTAAGAPPWMRPQLYRLVTAPLARGSDEWHLLARNYYHVSNEDLAGPPSVAGISFRSVTFSAPYDTLLAPMRHAAAGAVVEPVEGGIRCTVSGQAASAPAERCVDSFAGGDYVGVHIPVNGMRAVRFDLTLVDSDNVLGVYVNAEAESDRAQRWGWDLDPLARQFGFSGKVTLVPDYDAHRLGLVNGTASASEIRDLHIVIAVRPGAHAGFELRNVEIAEP
jgi:hypothetical protein